MVFDGEFSTVPIFRKYTINQNCTVLVKRSSQIGAQKNIGLKDTWFTSDLEEDTSEIPSHNPSFSPENNNNSLIPSQSITHAQ